MTENFKKVVDLISEMKASFTKSAHKFEQATLMDGTIIEFDSLEIGMPVFVVTETETIPAPEGTHNLSGEMEGVSIIVDANGIITDIIDAREIQNSSEEEETPIVEEKMSTEEVEAIVNAKFESFASSLESVVEMMGAIANQNESLTNQIVELKGDFETFKAMPVNATKEEEKFSKVGNLTTRQLWLKNNKNK
jgi:hypothetical protein